MHLKAHSFLPDPFPSLFLLRTNIKEKEASLYPIQTIMTTTRSLLLELPGELQDLIVSNLHPSAVIGLRQVSRYWRALLSPDRLDRLKIAEIVTYLHELEIHNDTLFLCSYCLCLKPRSSFTKSHVQGKRGKNGGAYHTRFCVDCGFEHKRILPGAIINMAEEQEPQVCCMGCSAVKRIFCNRCHWCFECAQTENGTGWRKYDGRLVQVRLMNRCTGHRWNGISPAPVPSAGYGPSILQLFAMYGFERDTGIAASPEWYDGI